MSIGIGLTQQVDHGYVVEAREDIDLSTQAQIADALSNAIAAGVALVVVDLTGVQFFAAAG